jgi:mono/diheme cytochrome c family protein
VLSCIVASLPACGGAKQASVNPSAPEAQAGPAALTCDTAGAVALADARLVVAKRCISCHSPSGAAGPDYDWTNESSLLAHRRNVAAQLAEDTMPPPGYPRPTLDERRTLLCWAKQ